MKKFKGNRGLKNISFLTKFSTRDNQLFTKKNKN